MGDVQMVLVVHLTVLKDPHPTACQPHCCGTSVWCMPRGCGRRLHMPDKLMKLHATSCMLKL